MPKPRSIRIEGDVAYVPLTRGYEVIIDAGDVPLVSAWSWSTRTVKDAETAYRIEGKKSVFMHRMLINASKGVHVDHINRNPRDNRRSNLRLCTVSQNNMNRATPRNSSSGVKGVNFDKRTGKWQVRVRADGQIKFSTRCSSFDDAVALVAKARIAHHGEFACQA